jgi:transcriptional regulatory protein LevR
MEAIASKEGVNRITLLLRGWAGREKDIDWEQEELPLSVRFEQIAQKLSYFAPSIDKTLAAEQAALIVQQTSALIGGNTPPDLQVRMYIHIITMFERLKTQESMPMPDDEANIMNRYPELCSQLTEFLEGACTRMGLRLQLPEVYYFLLTLPERDIP